MVIVLPAFFKGLRMQEKMFVFDTNVLVHDPESIFNFAGAVVGIPVMVLEELDKLKAETTFRGRNTREVIRYLDALRERGSLKDGVLLDNGGRLQVLFSPEKALLPLSFKTEDPDNQILLTVLAQREKGFDVRLISKDLNMRVKADVLGINAIDYFKDTVSRDHFYKGWVKIQVPAVQLKKESPQQLLELAQEHSLLPNEFLHIESQHNPYNYRIYRYINSSEIKPVQMPTLHWPLQPRNPQQLMALDLLLDNSIPFVTLLGPAGTGKTFLTLLAALHKILIDDEFEKMLVSRPVIPLGPDIGYLPGDIQEKLHSWMQPIYDNMDFIVHAANIGAVRTDTIGIHYDIPVVHGRKKIKQRRAQRDKNLPSLDELIKMGKISLEAITYMRGRSIPYQYILIDEVQNLTPHEVKTLISRVGEGSKIILAGDPYQIDSPYLDFSSNGLVVASNKFKGQSLFGTVFLEVSERSELSKLAAELL